MSLLRPRLVLDHVTDITTELLARHGLRGLLLDLDNTLIAYGSYESETEIASWAGQLQAAGIRLYMFSNATRERVAFWTGRLGMGGKGLASKPLPLGFRRAAARMGLTPGEVGMVGDQLFTDVLGGNLVGMFTIMVRPLADNALPHTRFVRRLERLIMRRYGPLAGQDPAEQHPAGPDKEEL